MSLQLAASNALDGEILDSLHTAGSRGPVNRDDLAHRIGQPQTNESDGQGQILRD